MSVSSDSSSQEDIEGIDSTDETLLYDILVYKEWAPQVDPKASEAILALDQAAPTQQGWSSKLSSALRWSRGIKNNGVLPERVSLLLASRSAWEISLTEDGSLLAILQDSYLEIYQKDSYQAPLSKVRINRDPLPTFRKLCWSPDGALLAVTTTNGQVDIYDSYGFMVFPIFSQKLPGRDASHCIQNAYTGVFFTDLRVKSREWLYELILVDFSGKINSFLLSPSGYQEFTSFSLSSQSLFSQGSLTSVTFSAERGLLCIAGPALPSESSGPSRHGLSMWRLLGEPPYYDYVPPYDQLLPTASSSRFLITSYLYPGRRAEQDHVYMMELSPSGKELSAVHISGAISIWQVPSLRPVVLVRLEDQPAYDDLNPTLLQNPKFKKRKKQFLKNDQKWLPLMIRWWNDNELIVVRVSGGVSIINLDKSRNLLGESAEFFAGAPAISRCFGGGFFILECDASAARKSNDSTSELMDSSDTFANADDNVDSGGDNNLSSDDEDEDEDLSILQRGKRAVTNLAYNLTESERFAPPRKKPRLLMQTYRLLSLNSTTPEELYARKIEMEEYGEALILAQHYNLDSDQVYERQWKLSNLSVTAIRDYLTKVKRRSLVLRECTKTVPKDVDAVRELLQYGLKETDCDVISSDNDDLARFIAEKPIVPTPTYLTEEEITRQKSEQEEELLSKVNWKNLTVHQKDILSLRRRLLRYLDRLDGFLSVLEEEADYEKRRIDNAADDFDPKLYIQFRDQTILQSAVEFARKGRIGALTSLLSRYPDELDRYILGILANIPESLSPINYSHLVPFNGTPLTIPGVNFSQNKKKDWSDFEFVRQTLFKDPAADDQDEIRKVVKRFSSKFIVDKNLQSKALLSTWINERAQNIYEESALVDHALALLNCAEINGLSIDSWLQHRLLVTETLMFTLHNNNIINNEFLSIKKLTSKSHLDIALTLMDGANAGNLMNLFSKTLSPFLDRLEGLEPGSRDHLLQNYLLNLATTSLELPTVFLKASLSTDGVKPLYFGSLDDAISIGIDCIYADESEENFDLATDLASFLRKKCHCPRMKEELSDILDILRTIKLVKKYSIQKSLQYFKSSRSNQKVMEELAVQMTRRAEGKKPKLNAREWSDVLEDLFELRRLCPLILTEWFCIEALCNSLLCSESMDNIKMVQDVFGHSIADVLFKSSAKSSPIIYILSMYKVGSVPPETQKRIVVKACQYYFDSCRDVDDSNLNFVRACLQLLPEAERTSPDMDSITNFLTALEMLHEFGVSILPIILKNAETQKNVVRKILQVDPQAYKYVRKIIKLIKLLASLRQTSDITGADAEEEAAILSLVADFALKASDYDACLAICDILMTSHKTSPAACSICAQLVDKKDFINAEAKAQLTSFCIAYCPNDELESMLERRKKISFIIDDVIGVEEAQPPTTSLASSLLLSATSDITSQPVALVKAAAEQTSRVLPESSSRAISSIWGKITQVTAGLQTTVGGVMEDREQREQDVPKLRAIVEEEIMNQLPSRKLIQLSVDGFYEDLFPQCRPGRLRVNFEGYGARRPATSIDFKVFQSVRKYYETGDDTDLPDWSTIKDLLVNLITTEDCALGLSFLMTELGLREAVVAQEVFEDSRMSNYVLYAASLFALRGKLGSKVFGVPPGLVYAAAKALHENNQLDCELFDNALMIAECE